MYGHINYGMSIVTNYNNRLTLWTALDLFGTRFNMPQASRLPFSQSFSHPSSRTLTTITLSSWGHVIEWWRNRFDSHRWNTRCCSDSTTARHRAMFDPSQLSSYTRISLRSSNSYVYLRKSRGGQRGIQDIGCLHLIQGYWRSKDTREYGIRAARREPIVDYGWSW